MKQDNVKDKAQELGAGNVKALLSKMREAYNACTRKTQRNWVVFMQEHDEYSAEDILEEVPANAADEALIRRKCEEAREEMN